MIALKSFVCFAQPLLRKCSDVISEVVIATSSLILIYTSPFIYVEFRQINKMHRQPNNEINKEKSRTYCPNKTQKAEHFLEHSDFRRLYDITS
jgi:hypothetical protein